MNEITDISDLRPAPRVSSTPVLWAMVGVMLVALGILLGSQGAGPSASLSASASQARQRSASEAGTRRAVLDAEAESMRRTAQAARVTDPSPVSVRPAAGRAPQ